MGDSLSAGFHLASPVETALRLLAPGPRSWFLDRRAQGRARDLVHGLAPGVELLAVSRARAMARVVPRAKGPLVGRIAAASTFRRQVELWCERTPVAPSLVCVWIGHNDLDWAHEPSPPAADALGPDDVRRRADVFESAFEEALGSLVAHARSRAARTAIVVFGLVNFRSFFRAREMAEAQRLRTPTRFPYLEAAYRYYPSMQPRYREGMVVLADAFDERIRSLVLRSARALPEDGLVSLEHSPALSDVSIEDSRLLSAWDAWHPSSRGHASLAHAAFEGARRSIRWLGLDARG